MDNKVPAQSDLELETENLRRQIAQLRAQVLTLEKEKNLSTGQISGDAWLRLIKQFPLGVQIFDTAGLCIGVNAALLQIFGVETEDQLVGKFNLFTDFMAERVGTKAAGLAALAGKAVHSPEVHFDFREANPEFTATEGQRVLAVTFFPIRNKLGDIVQIVALNEDITDRKITALALQQAEFKYRSLVEQLPVISYIIEFGETTKTLFISPQVETLLGFTPAEWLADQQLWIKQIHPEDRDEVVKAVKLADEEQRGLDLEYRILTRDGRVLWFRNQTTLSEESVLPRYTHGIMIDITHQKRLEDQLRQVQKMEAVGQMAAGIAHNFNNVLTTMLGYTEFALDTLPDNHPVRFDLEAIKKGTVRAADLTRQLLTFSRHQVTRPHNLNLSEVVLNVDPILRQLINHSVELVIAAPPDLWNVRADSNQLEQVLVNLVANAQDAIPGAGKITISIANISLSAETQPHAEKIPPGDYVLLTMADTGLGISKAVQPHIFEPFFTTKEVGQGTGLGLSTCFGLIEQNKGYLLFESEEGQGTTFFVYLPRAVDNKPKNLLTGKINTELVQGTETVLLVEDAVMVRQMSSRVLRLYGYKVIEARDGEDALQHIAQQPVGAIDLLITDLNLPKLSGDVLIGRVKELYPTIKLLLITGYSNRAVEDKGFSAERVPILSKPFSPDVLVTRVRQVLDMADEQEPHGAA
jgi:PAS domain S-box-containing protein